MRKIFLECGGESSTRPFYKKLKLNMSQNEQPKMLYSLFLLYVQVEVYQSILKLKCWPLSLTLYKAFWKIRKGQELFSLPHCLNDFWRKICLMLYSLNWLNFIIWLPLLLEILGKMCVVIICLPVRWRHKFLNWTWLSYQGVFLHDQKARQKLKYLKNNKSF